MKEDCLFCKIINKEIPAKVVLENDKFLTLNTGAKAGQTVFHLHAHLLGGKELGWPNID